jgi:hypothetical protein
VKVPFIYQAETRSLVPGAGNLPLHRAIATRDGRVAFVGVQEMERYSNAGVNQLVVINSDGSLPADGALRTVLAPVSALGASLALSPDEKTIYATGLHEGAYQGKLTHVVYRFGRRQRGAVVADAGHAGHLPVRVAAVRR